MRPRAASRLLPNPHGSLMRPTPRRAARRNRKTGWTSALLAQQFRNVAYAVLTGEAPKQQHPLPFSMDLRAQEAVLANLPPSVAQEAGEFYENAGAGRPRGTILKRDAMAVAWRGVLRPYLIGLRDHIRYTG